MNLKEAFRFQNKLRDLSQEAVKILSNPGHLVKTETTILCKKVMPEDENQVIVSNPTTRFADQINELADFLMYLLEQRTELGNAVSKAKRGMELDFDLETGLNSQRHEFASIFQKMAALRSSETMLPGGGTGYRFNAEGNQVTYRCDAKTVILINFDRNQMRRLAAKLYQQADEVSTLLDVALVTTQVDYQPPLDVNGTFDSIFEHFCENHQENETLRSGCLGCGGGGNCDRPG